MNEYLKAFVIGSSFLVFAPYFYGVSHSHNKQFTYTFYTFIGPIGLGLINMLSLFIANTFNLTTDNRFIVISILAPTIVIFLGFIFKFYDMTFKERMTYIIGLYALYIVMFNIIVKNLTLSI